MMPYSETVTVTIDAGASSTSQFSGATAPAQAGDALVVGGVWSEISGQSGGNLTLRAPYAGAAQASASALLVRFSSSNASPSLRQRAEYQYDKLRQKLGEELVHFLTH